MLVPQKHIQGNSNNTSTVLRLNLDPNRRTGKRDGDCGRIEGQTMLDSRWQILQYRNITELHWEWKSLSACFSADLTAVRQHRQAPCPCQPGADNQDWRPRTLFLGAIWNVAERTDGIRMEDLSLPW